jgi:hypothetical protein
MTNDELVKKVEELLSTDADLDFLLVLRKRDMEKLVACIRGRLDQSEKRTIDRYRGPIGHKRKT